MQMQREEGGKASFHLDREKVISALREGLIRNREALAAHKEWTGWDEKEGLWSEAIRLDGILRRKYGFGFLPAEC